MNGPNPANPHPMEGFDQICYLKNIINNPNIIIGDYTYYDDPVNSKAFEKNVLYHYPFIGDKLIIGKFCAIAHKVKFIMNGANHKMSSFMTYPFQIFGNGWEKISPSVSELLNKGDTIIGNDVWIGYDSLIMPGVQIGNGAIIASKSVVVKDVEPYTIVGGNPAITIKKRFPEDTIKILQKLKWWDWDVSKITNNLEILTGLDIERLKNLL